DIDERTEVLLVTGIANPQPLKKYIEEKSHAYYMMQYRDHHIFRIDDLREIKKKFENIEGGKKILLTTEKDAVRLIKFKYDMHHLPFYVIPVSHHFLFGEEEKFNELVRNFITGFQKAGRKTAESAAEPVIQ